MKDQMITVSEFKATCLKIIEKVKTTGLPVTITKNGKPTARLVPCLPSPNEHACLFGALADEVLETGDIISPLGPQDWEVLR